MYFLLKNSQILIYGHIFPTGPAHLLPRNSMPGFLLLTSPTISLLTPASDPSSLPALLPVNPIPGNTIEKIVKQLNNTILFHLDGIIPRNLSEVFSLLSTLPLPLTWSSEWKIEAHLITQTSLSHPHEVKIRYPG